MSKTAATHDVFNQPPDLADFNLFDSDPILVAATKRGSEQGACKALSAYGYRLGRAETLEWGALANKHTPELVLFDRKGRRTDVVEFHPSYHHLMTMSMAEGLHCSVWDRMVANGNKFFGQSVARGAGIYMVSQVEPGHVCPITMTNASVATLLLNDKISQSWLPKVLSREYDPELKKFDEKASVTIGMGMTEKQGGTDVRANTSTAIPLDGSGGEYLITGHKWFLSAPMCDAFFVLAQAPGGLSCFFMPRVLEDGSLNGLYFQRLKPKLGNKSNASSEVEFRDAHAWLVGEEGRGINAIIEMVTLTRLDCILAAAGMARWGLANAIHHTRHRTVFQKKLIDQPMMASVLADLALDSEAATLLAFRLAEAFDHASDNEMSGAFSRIMSPVIKYLVCKMVPAIASEALECMGGNGFVEEGPMARLYREAPLNSIWEGSGNVMCLDVLRSIGRDPEGFEGIIEYLIAESDKNKHVMEALERVRTILQDPSRAETEARFATEQFALATAAALMQRNSTGDAADAYAKSRLDGRWRATYGTFGGVDTQPDHRAIINRAMPELA